MMLEYGKCACYPVLVNIYIEELVARIRVSGKGVKVGDRRSDAQPMATT